jgi:serine/threonine-protein kinase
MPDLSGKQLKDYQLLRRLGRGAMAEVYLAEQLSLGRRVAFKVLNAELARDPSHVGRFQHEARASASLVHASIVQVYEVGHVDEYHFIAQEYVPGRNLGEVIHRCGRLAPGLTLEILRQVASALQKAAEQGIVHRDIKPENIMVARTGEVKVADFGLARVQGNGMNLTQVGLTMGTPLYMSPEQIEGRPLDSRSDIYSLGVTAYHMLTGQPPFGGDTPLAVAVQHLNSPCKPLQEQMPSLPVGMTQLVHRMLAKKPEERFSDPADLLREVHRISSEAAAQGWAEGPAQWSLTEMIAMTDAGSEAASRLGEAMKTSMLLRPNRLRWGSLALLAAAGILVGIALAILVQPSKLLGDVEGGPPAQKTAWAQLYHAKMVNTDVAWQAVWQNFPDAQPYYHNLAREGLVRYYFFRAGQYDRAIPDLEQLARDSQMSFRVFGIAGLAIAHAKLGQFADAERENARLSSSMRGLLEEQAPDLAQLLDEMEQALFSTPGG